MPRFSTLFFASLMVACVFGGGPGAWAALNVNANGTVSDSTTGLVWDQCVYGHSDPHCSTGVALLTDWSTALTMATRANAARYKGFDDWRLPNVKELESIVKIDTSLPAIDSVVLPNTPMTVDTSGYVWTSTVYAPNPSSAWSVDFENGFVNAVEMMNVSYVRLVRGGYSLAAFDALSTPRKATE